MFTFNYNKAIQATAYLLRREPSKEMNYLRLIKILYIADRESIRQIGRPITGDQIVAMQRGPVLSELYDLIKGAHIRSPEWTRYIHKDEYIIRLVEDPGLEHLNRFDIDTIERVAEEHRAHDEWDMVNFTHKFPEWQKNKPEGNTRNKIPFIDIFSVLGQPVDPEIEKETNEDRAFSRLFGD